MERAGTALHLVDQQVDTSTAMGRLFLTILAAVAEMERNLIGERTAAALAQVRAEGGRIGREGFGWSRIPETDHADRLKIVSVDEERDAIDRAVELRDEGWTYEAIALQLQYESRRTKRGGRWHPGTVRRLILRARSAA